MIVFVNSMGFVWCLGRGPKRWMPEVRAASVRRMISLTAVRKLRFLRRNGEKLVEVRNPHDYAIMVGINVSQRLVQALTSKEAQSSIGLSHVALSVGEGVLLTEGAKVLRNVLVLLMIRRFGMSDEDARNKTGNLEGLTCTLFMLMQYFTTNMHM